MGMDHRKVKAYLLYTRYPLLYPARPSWAMVRRVMDVRNRIVANEYGMQLRNSPHYTAERLKDIHPDTLNERHLNNTLWKRYLYPAIDAVMQRLRALTPLEQCYSIHFIILLRRNYTLQNREILIMKGVQVLPPCGFLRLKKSVKRERYYTI